MHFLKRIIETPILEDPTQNYMEVHRHFYRYSKGIFIGPALKISQSKTKITLKGSHEYEDLIQELVVRSIKDQLIQFEIKGTLITGSDPSNLISSLGFNWDIKRSTGQTKNYKATILDRTNRDQLLKAIETLRKNSYLLISLNVNANCKITTKKNIPQPSKKKIEDDDINQRIQFCTGYLVNSENNLEILIEEALPDFRSEIPNDWKSITILNNYKITDIILPTNIQDSRLLRIMAIRKGKLIRTVEIDNEVIEKQYSFVV
ncbi:MAG: hypothetical protein EAX89_07175 [Candidatus Lokiarchaeota archaeon]|nr:hypothetical protein [Candidatus Lokiarchaeota archaeon]